MNKERTGGINRTVAVRWAAPPQQLVCNFDRALRRCGGRGDNGGPTDGAHSNAPLRGGSEGPTFSKHRKKRRANPKTVRAISELNFFEGGIRPACFVSSPLLPAAVRGTVYSGIVHETDYFKTFATLANANLDKVPKLDVSSKPFSRQHSCPWVCSLADQGRVGARARTCGRRC